MQACGRLVARKGEQDVDRDIAAGIEIDGGDMAPVMGDLDDPAIDDKYVAARQIGQDIGRNVVTIGEERQPVGPIVEQPDRIVRSRAGPDVAPMLAGDFKAVAIGAGHDGRAPAFGKARNIRHLVGDAIAQDQAARRKAFAIPGEDGEIVDGAGDAVGPGIDQPDRWIARQLLPRLCQDVQRWLVIVGEQTMRVAGEAIARQAGIENGDLAAGTAELQGAGETGKAAADDDDVIHGDGLRWRTGGNLPIGLHISDTIWYRNSRIIILSSTGIVVTENSQGRRGRPANQALGQTIVDAASELFVELGFQATTLDKVAQRAKISKLSIYRHFENKEALFSAAIAAGCHQLLAPQVLLEGVDGSVEDQLMAVGSSLLRTLLRSDVRSVEAMVMADKTNQNSLSKLHYEAS